MTNRWWIYQQERFPVFAHGLLIAAFISCAVVYSAAIHGRDRLPEAEVFLVAFVVAFLIFLQMRIADEFKDCAEDARYRPYRPVPRGLVTLRELATVAVFAAGVQWGLAFWLAPGLVVVLLVVWVYLGLMTREFFHGAWLRQHPVVYLLSHMVILPLITLFATACDWIPSGTARLSGLIPLLLASYGAGIVIEIGRKIRARADEEPGVETYTLLWGQRNAVLVWWGAIIATLILGWVVTRSFVLPAAGAALISVIALPGLIAGWRFLQGPGSRRAKAIDTVSGLTVLAVHLAIGVLSFITRLEGMAL